MPNISPVLWFDNVAEEAMAFYTATFDRSRIVHIERYPDASLDEHFIGMSGKVITGIFDVQGKRFRCLDGGPLFSFNPSISFYCQFNEQSAIEAAWDTLVVDGSVLMEFKAYPFAQKYGWLKDQYGVTWQLSLSEQQSISQPITPLLLYTNDQAGKAKEAMHFYRGARKAAVP